jgi:hypothetical protein
LSLEDCFSELGKNVFFSFGPGGKKTDDDWNKWWE